MKSERLPDNSFPHSYMAHDKNELIKLRKTLGWEGYGIYWALVEMQYVHTMPIFDNYATLAELLDTDEAKIKSVVEDFGLFHICKDGRPFWNNKIGIYE